MGIRPSKNNFFPRPRDQAHAVLLRPILEVRGDSVITCMAVFNNRLYFAGQHPPGPTNAPRLYRWDASTDTVAVPIALPAAFAAAGNTQIVSMVVFGGQLWIVTGQSGVIADNGQLWVLNANETWAAGPAPFAFPGYTGGAAANMHPVLFLFGGNLNILARGNDGVLRRYSYTGAVWAVENTALGVQVDSLTPVVDAAGILLFGAGANVIARNLLGVYAQAIGGTGTNTPAMAMVNNQVWFAQTGGTPLIGVAWPVASQLTRIFPIGANFMHAIPSNEALSTTRGETAVVGRRDGDLDLLDTDGSLRLMVASDDDDIRQMVTYNQRVYVAQGSLAMATLAATAEVTARVSILE